MNSEIKNGDMTFIETSLYFAGMRDCKDGREPVRDDKCYMNGYNIQYQFEQVMSNQERWAI